METTLLLVERESEKQQTATGFLDAGPQRFHHRRQQADPLLPFKYKMSKKEVVVWAPDKDEADSIYAELCSPAG